MWTPTRRRRLSSRLPRTLLSVCGTRGGLGSPFLSFMGSLRVSTPPFSRPSAITSSLHRKNLSRCGISGPPKPQPQSFAAARQPPRSRSPTPVQLPLLWTMVIFACTISVGDLRPRLANLTRYCAFFFFSSFLLFSSSSSSFCCCCNQQLAHSPEHTLNPQFETYPER